MAVLQYKDPVTGQLKDLPLINQGVKEAPIDGKQYVRKDGEWSEIDVDSNVDLSDYTTKGELNNALLGKVDKQEGKQLTTEDFTTVLKEKLEGLSNYNDTEIRNAIDSLESAFNTLVEGNATVAIDTFNEIVAFLKNIENSQDLDSIIAGINTTISKVEAKIPDTNNLLSKDGGTMNNTNLVGNLNADLLDGLHSDSFAIIGTHPSSSDSNYNIQSGIYRVFEQYEGFPGVYARGHSLIHTNWDTNSAAQLLLGGVYDDDVYYRTKVDNQWKNWRTIMFTGDTAAAANRLSTTRYLWGQSFDGSEDVNGEMNFLSQGNLITAGGESWANNIVLSIGYDTTNGDWTKLGVAGAGSNSAGLILTHHGRVGIGVDYPTHKLHINGAIKAEYNPDYNLAHDIIGEAHFYNDSYSDPATSTKAAIKVNGVIAQSSGNVLLCTTSGNVGIGTSTPVSELHVVGKPIFNHNGQHGDAGLMIIRNDASITGWDRAIFAHYPNLEAGAHANFHIGKADSGKNGGYISYYHAGDSSDNNCMTIGLYATDDILNITANRRVGINTTTPEHPLDVNGAAIIRGALHTIDHILLDGTDQINGKYRGIALNYNCGKYVDTSIWDGQGNTIMRVFGEGRQVAIGAHSVDTPRGTLNVDGEVIFEQSRFTTTSGFVDGEYAYSHAIYGGYHGIDVCEFYENEFRFKTNGGDTTSFTLNRYYADFNGTVRTYNCDFTGVHWNGNTRFRLIRDGEYSTWLQAGTDTTAENGRLYMSGLNGALLHQFNVWTSVSNFKGSIIAEGDVTAYSDIRLKNRIESVNNVLDTIDTLDVFRYTWKNREDKSVHIGVSAQQVQTIYPEFVLTSSSEDGTDYLTVNYAALATCIAIQGIKELVKKSDERDKIIAALEEEVISLKEQLRYGNK